jgi:hypothetical protein
MVERGRQRERIDAASFIFYYIFHMLTKVMMTAKGASTKPFPASQD